MSLSAIFFYLFLFSSSISYYLFFPCIPSFVFLSPFLLYLILPCSCSNLFSLFLFSLSFSPVLFSLFIFSSYFFCLYFYFLFFTLFPLSLSVFLPFFLLPFPLTVNFYSVLSQYLLSSVLFTFYVQLFLIINSYDFLVSYAFCFSQLCFLFSGLLWVKSSTFPYSHARNISYYIHAAGFLPFYSLSVSSLCVAGEGRAFIINQGDKNEACLNESINRLVPFPLLIFLS